MFFGDSMKKWKIVCAIMAVMLLVMTSVIYSELVLYPLGYTTQPTDEDELFRGIANGISSINGYEVMQAGELYLTSGDSDDWLYGEKGVLAFTIELGKEHSPEYNEVLNISETHVGVNLYVAEIADNPGGEWVIRGEKPKGDRDSIFDSTSAYLATTITIMIIIFGIVLWRSCKMHNWVWKKIINRKL